MGLLLKWLINAWILMTGQRYRYADHPWLRGPVGEDLVIGDAYYERFAAREGLTISRESNGGLLRNLTDVLQADDPMKERLLPEIAAFYEHTAAYKLEVWSQWYAPYAFFARVLIRTLSTRMNQLNIPLQPMETSRGMSNEVIHLKDAATGAVRHACWLRKSLLSRRVVYSGFYSGIRIGGRPFVRVVFPLPQGNATVLLWAEVQPDGSLKLISDGKRTGDAGYYRVQEAGSDAVRLRHIPLKEVIHVFKDEAGDLRTDHFFAFLGVRMLHLHYKIIPLLPSAAA